MDTTDRVVGVYYDRHRQRWQVRFIRAGAGRSLSYTSEAEALRKADWLRGEIARAAAQTVGALLEEWIATQQHLTSGTRRTRRAAVLWLLPAEMTAAALGRAQGAALLERAVRTSAQRSVASQRQAAKEARRFCQWLMECRGLGRNPVEGLTVAGRTRRGHESHQQLSRVQVRAFLSEAHKRRDPASIAAACFFLLGRRIGDLLGTPERHGALVGGVEIFAAGGGVVRGLGKGSIPWTSPIVSVPEYPDLADRLAALVAGRGPDEPLFPGRVPGQQLCQATARRACRDICAAAKVPQVCPHGLRGTLATLAAEAEVPEAIAARALGHTQAVHRQHYAQRDAAEARAQAAGLRALDRSAEIPRAAEMQHSPTAEK